MPAELRQTVELGRKRLGGHASFVPSQFSAVSQTPAEARHGVLVPALVSAGHAVFEPSQSSTTSHTPAEARQSGPALPARRAQTLRAPSQVSGVLTVRA